jgi:hypothetical protein
MPGRPRRQQLHPGGNWRGFTQDAYGKDYGATGLMLLEAVNHPPDFPTRGGPWGGSGHPQTGELLHQALRSHDVVAFRHELTTKTQEPYADPNERNEDGRTCIEQVVAMIEVHVVRSLCSSHVVEHESTARLPSTIKHLKALLQIGKMLVQDPRTLAPEGMFLKDFPAPFFLLAVIKTCCEDYPDPETGLARNPSDILAVGRLMSEILSDPKSRHYKHVVFLSQFPKFIRNTVELVGRERFAPTPMAAQRFMQMAFIFNEPGLFKCSAMTRDLYACGNLCNWDEVLSVLQETAEKYKDFFFALLSSKLRGSIRNEFTAAQKGGLPMRMDSLVPDIHISHRLLEATQSVFGDEVSNCAVRLRQRYLRPVPPRTASTWKHSALAEELAEMSWKDVCTAVRSIS